MMYFMARGDMDGTGVSFDEDGEAEEVEPETRRHTRRCQWCDQLTALGDPFCTNCDCDHEGHRRGVVCQHVPACEAA